MRRGRATLALTVGERIEAIQIASAPAAAAASPSSSSNRHSFHVGDKNERLCNSPAVRETFAASAAFGARIEEELRERVVARARVTRQRAFFFCNRHHHQNQQAFAAIVRFCVIKPKKNLLTVRLNARLRCAQIETFGFTREAVRREAAAAPIEEAAKMQIFVARNIAEEADNFALFS